ncbi:MAG: hypothetical protein K8W52_34135 [Deltaproteobacteria bacterium]|nr:hypothetical protein [Deltaproteobacteria bacterium]
MAGRSSFTIEVVERDGIDQVSVSGVVDENADLALLSTLGGRPVRVNLKGVRRINSFGVRAWMDAVRKVPRDVVLTFAQAPSPVIDQCNMVTGFLGHGTLESFFAPMTCGECDEQVDQLFETAACRANGGKLPSTPCPRCGRPMEVDDLEDQYLLFVREAV